jgi:membrane protease YdiL (CAAX protease family)
MNYLLISPISQIRHLPNARLFSLQKNQNSPTVARKAFSKDDDTTPTTSIPSPANDPVSPLGSDSVWDTCKTLTQLWAIVLPLGYAGIPLAARALSHLPGGPSLAAFGGEALALSAVLVFLRQKDFKLQFEINFKSVVCGLAAGIVALIVNQILFSSGGGGHGDDGMAATTTTATADILLSNSNPAVTLSLFIASALLAPATEEIIYRGFFLGSLIRLGVSPVIAVGGSAVAFSAAHLQPDAFLQLTLVGVCLGGAAVSSKGNVLAPFIGHATYNSALFLNLLLSLTDK